MAATGSGDWADVIVAFEPLDSTVARSVREIIATGPSHRDAVGRIYGFLRWIDMKPLFEVELRCSSPPAASLAAEDHGLETRYLGSRGASRRYRIGMRRSVYVEIAVSRTGTVIDGFGIET